MRLRLNTLVSGFVVCLLASAASATGDTITLETWLPDQCHYSGNFNQTRTLQSLPVPIQSSGQFLVDCEAGVIWQTESPIFEAVVYTESMLDFLIADQTRLMKGLVNHSMSKMLRALMGGETAYLLNNFVTDTESVAHQDTLALLPNRKSVSRYLQRIELSRSDRIVNIKLVHNDIEATAITISGISLVSNPGVAHCRSIYGDQSDVCEGLYSPVKLAESLKLDR